MLRLFWLDGSRLNLRGTFAQTRSQMQRLCKRRIMKHHAPYSNSGTTSREDGLEDEKGCCPHHRRSLGAWIMRGASKTMPSRRGGDALREKRFS